MSSTKKHRGAAYREYRPYYIERPDGQRLRDWTTVPYVWAERGYPFDKREAAEDVLVRHFVGAVTARARGYRIVRS